MSLIMIDESFSRIEAKLHTLIDEYRECNCTLARLEEKRAQKYFWNYIDKRDERSRKNDDDGITHKVVADIPIFLLVNVSSQ